MGLIKILEVVSFVGIFLASFGTTVSDNVTIGGRIVCTMMCTNVTGSTPASAPPPGVPIEGANIKVECSRSSTDIYARGEANTNTAGVFSITLVTTSFDIKECMLFVFIPSKNKCNQPQNTKANEGKYKMDWISFTTPVSGTYDTGPLQYFAPEGKTCPLN